MNRSPDALRALAAVIRADIAAIRRIENELARIVPPGGSVEALAEFAARAGAAYALHNIYNALENTFEQISRTFENHVVDAGKWHAELLGKMFLDIPEVRPAVFSSDLRLALEDLRGFRHVFRHSYGIDLNPEKTLVAVERWWAASEKVEVALDRFANWLLARAAKGKNTSSSNA